ncbi:MAG: ABC transporter permease [Anaerolineaceae bacterium]|nr:ABC transporter permease [Anaerolineaceae bacterium]
MGKYIARRLLLMIPTLLGMSILIFGLMRLVPADAVDAMLGSDIKLAADEREQLRKMFGLDQPLYIQYFSWLGDAVHGDLGKSFRTSEPVLVSISHRVGITAELAVLSVLLSAAVAIPLGVLAALKRNGFTDLVIHLIALLGLSMPYFWLAALYLLITSVYLKWQPPIIWASPLSDLKSNLSQMILPVLSLSAGLVAIVMRMTRSSILEVLDQDYIRTARAKGLRERVVIIRHALKNAAIPIITVIGLQLGSLIGGAVVIEQMFGLPGIGTLILNGVYNRDYPVVQGSILFFATVFVFVNLLVDLLYAYADPRIRYS